MADKKIAMPAVPLGIDLFNSGYDKGHEDGVKHALIVLRLAFDRHPVCIGPVEWALVTAAQGETLKGLVNEFAQRCINRGRAFEKDLQAGRAPMPVPVEVTPVEAGAEQ